MSLLQASEDKPGIQLAAVSSQPPIPILAIKKREVDLRNIEYGITEVNEMMRQISSMINEQQESISLYCFPHFCV